MTANRPMFPGNATAGVQTSDSLPADPVPSVPQSPALAATTQPEQDWSLAKTVLAVPFVPALAARHSQHVSLPAAFAVHAASVLLAVVLIFTAVALVQTILSLSWRWVLTWDAFVSEWQALFADLSNNFRWYPKQAILGALAGILWVELTTLALALTTMSWGARDEPLVESTRHAIRRIWLQSPHGTLCVLLIAAQIVSMTWIHETFPTGVPNLYEFVVPPTVAFIAASSLWILWAFLRASGIRRDGPAILRPPLCEQCGYNLTTIPMESRCPECGEAVSNSLPAAARPGSIWQQRRHVGCWTAYRTSIVETFRQPIRFGRRLLVTAHVTDHRRFLALHLPLIFLFGVAAILCVVGFLEGPRELIQHAYVSIFVGTAVGLVCVLGAVLFTVSMATSVGFKESRREGRNLLPGAIQVACYLAGYLTVWAFVGGIVTAAVIILDETKYFRLIEEHFGMKYGILRTVVWSIPNAAFGVWYVVLLHRGVQGTRYANR